MLPFDQETRGSLINALECGTRSAGQLMLVAVRDAALYLELSRWAASAGGDILRPGKLFHQQSAERLASRLRELPEPADPLPDAVHAGYEVVRSKCGVTAVVSAIIARALVASETDRALTLGLVRFLGDAATSINQPETYLAAAARGTTRPEVVAILKEESGHDLDRAAVDYLKAAGGLAELGEVLTGVLQGDEGRVALSVQLAAEMLDRFDGGTWGESAAPESFGTLGTRVAGLLTETTFDGLHSAVSNFLLWGTVPEGLPEFLDSLSAPRTAASAIQSHEESDGDAPILVVSPEGMDVQAVEPPDRHPQTVSNIGPLVFAAQEITKNAHSVEQLVSELMNFLVVEAPFERTALLEVSSEARRAVPILVRGKVEKTQGHAIETNDPNSPLFRQSLSVRSFDRGGSNCSPFDSRAFALAPVDFSGGSPVALYADAGQDVIISLDGRRLFRAVVDLLNGRIRTLPGVLPRDG